MNGKRLLAGGLLTVAIVIASTSVSWSQPVLPEGSAAATVPADVTGIAGPAGPQQISPVAAYFKRVTYPGYELSESVETSERLPAGRYLIEVLTPGSTDTMDCLGVSFPLVPPQGNDSAYTGYVTVAKSGDEVSVYCFEEPPDPTWTDTYELYFVPVG